MNHFFHFMNKMLKKGDTKNLNGYNKKLLFFFGRQNGEKGQKNR